MQTRTGFTTAARAETLARLLHGKLDEGEGRALERAERVAHAVGTDRRRAMVWVRQTLDYEGVTRPRLLGLGFEWWVVNAADTLVVRPREDVPAYAKRVAACTDADVLAVAGCCDRRRDPRGGRPSARLADRVRGGTPGGAARGRRPRERAARSPCRGRWDGRPPSDGAGPAHAAAVVCRPHQRRAAGDGGHDAWPGQCALGGLRAPVSGGPGTAGRQAARPDLRRRSVGGRRERAERGHVRGESDPDQVQDGNGAEARHCDDRANDRTPTATLLQTVGGFARCGAVDRSA